MKTACFYFKRPISMMLIFFNKETVFTYPDILSLKLAVSTAVRLGTLDQIRQQNWNKPMYFVMIEILIRVTNRSRPKISIKFVDEGNQLQ